MILQDGDTVGFRGRGWCGPSNAQPAVLKYFCVGQKIIKSSCHIPTHHLYIHRPIRGYSEGLLAVDKRPMRC